MKIGNLEFTPKQVIYEDEAKNVSLDTKHLTEGSNHTSDFLIYRSGQKMRVYDRTCDHNGGRLISNGGLTICPLHGWEFDLAKGRYTNVNCDKAPIYDGPIPDNHLLDIVTKSKRRVREPFTKNSPVSIRFLNHACLVFKTKDLCFATDPWLVGSAFCNGWWLEHPSPADGFDILNECDFIYISHNHPDHLHPETLKHVRKCMPILTANFKSGSTVRYLRDLGFKTIHALDFNEKWVAEGESLAISCLKSGDFRDDSGIFIEIGQFSAVLSVDANFIDFWRFPTGLDLLATSFASGASGFPLCFDNYHQNEKERIIERNRKSVLTTNKLMLRKAMPTAYLPYAGFFKERAQRDQYVAKHNVKNSIGCFEGICKDLGISMIDPTKTQLIKFSDAHFTTSTISYDYIDQKTPEVVIKADCGVQFDEVKYSEYFERSQYYKPLDLFILPCDDSFLALRDGIAVYFSLDQDPMVSDIMNRRQGVNYLEIRVREAELARVVSQGLPWENLMIGFQARVYREPNVYNSDFWYHFTNVYVNDRVKTRSMNCAGCEVISQSLY